MNKLEEGVRIVYLRDEPIKGDKRGHPNGCVVYRWLGENKLQFGWSLLNRKAGDVWNRDLARRIAYGRYTDGWSIGDLLWIILGEVPLLSRCSEAFSEALNEGRNMCEKRPGLRLAKVFLKVYHLLYGAEKEEKSA